MTSLALASTSFAVEKAVVDGPAAAEQTVEFNVYLPLRDRAATEAFLTELQTPGSASYHRWLTPAQFNERFGPQASTVNAITRELAAYGLQVTDVKTHSLHVSGTAAAVEAAFGARLSMGHFSSGRQVLIAATAPRLTPNLQTAGAMIPGFSGTIRMHKPNAKISPANRESPVGGYWFDDLKQAYSYPSYQKLTGKGVTIGILMTPGYNLPDITNYFKHEKIPAPHITTFNVEGGAPYDPTNPFNSAETFLDIEQSGGMAPQANIILYNLPDLADDSIFAGLTDIIENNNVDVVNMSFGEFEAAYSAAYPFNDGVNFMGILGLYDDFFMEGNALGITWVAASGDLGALQAPPPACFETPPPVPCGAMQLAVSTPASSPHVTAVGGTNLVTTFNAKNPDDLNSAYVSENADHDPLVGDIFYGTGASGAVWGSGGGISIYYPKPAYQELVSQKFLPKSAKKWRTNPDVALHMGGCPNGTVLINGACPPDRSFDWVGIDGGFFGFVGTSASSPDFVGLLALKIESEGSRLGNENFDIYSLAAAQAAGSGNKVYRQNIPGNNGFYNTAPGYNLVLGNGTIIGRDFVRGPALPAAGVPQTPSNP
ncbi:MAG: S53 family serine peptidase [Steroidobacteraceae bacterium]